MEAWGEVGRILETPGWGQDYPGSFVSWWSQSHTYTANLEMEEAMEMMEDDDTLVVELRSETWGGELNVGHGGPTRSDMIRKKHILYKEHLTWAGAEQVSKGRLQKPKSRNPSPFLLIFLCEFWEKLFMSQSYEANYVKVCVTHGGHLASIGSEEEYEIIERLVINNLGFESDVWIGGSDIEEDNEWRWTDGTVWNFTGRRQYMPTFI